MLRPATPLSVLLFAAFVLLLLSVISTPIISLIPLGSWEGVEFGVFGYCTEAGCSPIEIGYDVDLGDLHPKDFSLSASTRTTLSYLLIVHPVAAALTLIMFALAVIAHFHSPSHSPRYLLLLFLVGILNFLVTLLSFLVDVLLFVPHMAWGSYLVLAATILVALCGLISCAMRRVVIGRKARQKRIAQNAEMSGENYYNRQARQRPEPTTTTTVLSEPTLPVVSGANGGADALPEFASYTKKDDQSSDERIPLTHARSPSSRSPGTFTTDQTTYVNDAGSPTDIAPLRSMSASPGARDPYGNPMPAQDGYPMRSASVERVGSPPRGPMPPGGYRGRGGYSGPGRGGYGPPYGGRGGYGPPGRGGYGPPGGRGGYGPPPRGYGGPMRGGRTPPPPSYQGAQGGPYDRRGSPAGLYGPGQYGPRRPSPGPPSAPGYMNQSMSSASSGGYVPYSPPREEDLPRAESPPPLPGIDDGISSTEPVEMDASTPNSSNPQQGVQPGRAPSAERHMSGSSRYSQEEDTYVPPRQAWNQGPGRNSPRVPSPLNTRTSPPPQNRSPGGYYEDVDPRFANPPPPPQAQ